MLTLKIMLMNNLKCKFQVTLLNLLKSTCVLDARVAISCIPSACFSKGASTDLDKVSESNYKSVVSSDEFTCKGCNDYYKSNLFFSRSSLHRTISSRTFGHIDLIKKYKMVKYRCIMTLTVVQISRIFLPIYKYIY